MRAAVQLLSLLVLPSLVACGGKRGPACNEIPLYTLTKDLPGTAKATDAEIATGTCFSGVCLDNARTSCETDIEILSVGGSYADTTTGSPYARSCYDAKAPYSCVVFACDGSVYGVWESCRTTNLPAQ